MTRSALGAHARKERLAVKHDARVIARISSSLGKASAKPLRFDSSILRFGQFAQ
jgi:hypothetical protein